MDKYTESDRREQPYSNTPIWDIKTILTLLALIISTTGGIIVSWISLNNQLTTLSITQQLKFAEIEKQFNVVTEQDSKLSTSIDNLINIHQSKR